jgi:hypothetical protein
LEHFLQMGFENSDDEKFPLTVPSWINDLTELERDSVKNFLIERYAKGIQARVFNLMIVAVGSEFETKEDLLKSRKVGEASAEAIIDYVNFIKDMRSQY